MQPSLRARLEAQAEAAGRSLNAEITIRLEESLLAPEPTSLRAMFEASESATLEELLEMQRLMVGKHAGEAMYLHNILRAKLGVYDNRPDDD